MKILTRYMTYIYIYICFKLLLFKYKYNILLIFFNLYKEYINHLISYNF